MTIEFQERDLRTHLRAALKGRWERLGNVSTHELISFAEIRKLCLYEGVGVMRSEANNVEELAGAIVTLFFEENMRP